MASATPFPTVTCSNQGRITSFASSAAPILSPSSPKALLSASAFKSNWTVFSPWNGLRHVGISIRQHSVRNGKRVKPRGMVVYASLFGVGAPEVLVIGVVALLVFGPKGLAEVARNLGKTLRAFQPTIKELQEVSREFKTTLEREIGLDEVPPSKNVTPSTTSPNESVNPQAKSNPNGTAVPATSSEENSLKASDQASVNPRSDSGDPFEVEDNSFAEILRAASAHLGPPRKVEQEAELQVSTQEQPQATSEVAAGMPPSEMVESDESKS